MKEVCTSFHFLTFRPQISFDDPKSPDGSLWNSALKSIAQAEGWHSLRWGKRLDCGAKADLLIYWRKYRSLAGFLDGGFVDFLSIISQLLIDQAPPAPYVCEFHPLHYNPHHDAVSSVYQLCFDQGLDPETELGLGIAKQFHAMEYRSIATKLNTSDLSPGDDVDGLFQGMEMVWLHRGPSPMPASVEFGKLFAASRQPGPDPRTLLLATSWVDQDAERNIVRKYLEHPEYQGFKDPLEKDMLIKATSFTKHQVILEDVIKDNLEFLDKEEKWKTWMTRMIEEEDAKKRARLTGEGWERAEIIESFAGGRDDGGARPTCP